MAAVSYTHLIAQIYACAGANRIKVEEMVAGDIGCTVKLKDVHTGNRCV